MVSTRKKIFNAVAVSGFTFSAAYLTLSAFEKSKPPNFGAFPLLADSKSVNLINRNLTLYQYESCPFCRKVRGALDFAKLPYKIVEVHPLTKSETKPFAKDYGKVPVLTVEGSEESLNFQLRDSSKIVEAILSSSGRDSLPCAKSVTAPIQSKPAIEKKWKEEPEIADEWVRWTDGYLVQVIVVNIYRNAKESQQTFDYLLTHKSFSFFSKWAVYWSGTVVMTLVAGSRRAKLGINKGEEREALYEAIKMFIKSLHGNKFLGGSTPNKADLNVFGVMRSIEGFDSQKDLFANVPEFRIWYKDMIAAVGPSMAVDHENAGQRGDQILLRSC